METRSPFIRWGAVIREASAEKSYFLRDKKKLIEKCLIKKYTHPLVISAVSAQFLASYFFCKFINREIILMFVLQSGSSIFR